MEKSCIFVKTIYMKVERPYNVKWLTGEYDEEQIAVINGVKFEHNEEVRTEHCGKIGTVTMLCRYGDNKDGRIWKLMDGAYYSDPLTNFEWIEKIKS